MYCWNGGAAARPDSRFVELKLKINSRHSYRCRRPKPNMTSWIYLVSQSVWGYWAPSTGTPAGSVEFCRGHVRFSETCWDQQKCFSSVYSSAQTTTYTQTHTPDTNVTQSIMCVQWDVCGQRWLGYSRRLVVRRLLVRFLRDGYCRLHQCVTVCMNYCKSLWDESDHVFVCLKATVVIRPDVKLQSSQTDVFSHDKTLWSHKRYWSASRPCIWTKQVSVVVLQIKSLRRVVRNISGDVAV